MRVFEELLAGNITHKAGPGPGPALPQVHGGVCPKLCRALFSLRAAHPRDGLVGKFLIFHFLIQKRVLPPTAAEENALFREKGEMAFMMQPGSDRPEKPLLAPGSTALPGTG